MLLTKNSTPILSQIAYILGWILNAIFNFLNWIGFANTGMAIILFTIIVYTLMIPLTYKQQKFSKMSVRMNPEIQAIQKKYKNKQDQASMMKMQEETKAVYAKYGTSATGSCVQLLIQLPVLLAVYRVVYAIPAYVDKVKAAYFPLVDDILSASGGSEFIQNLSSASQFSKQDFTLSNTIIDVLNRASTTEWDSLAEAFPALSETIASTREVLDGFNGFLGLNITNSPWYSIKQAWGNGQFLIIIVAVLIPVLAGVFQWLSVKMTPQTASTGGDDQQAQMQQSMKMMNNIMPLMSVYFCLVLPVGVGLYWTMSAVVRLVQMIGINKYLDKMDIDAEMKKNIDKYNRKREKKGLSAEKMNEVAKTNAKSIESSNKKSSGKVSTAESRQKQIKESTEYYKKDAKPGSLASKARMVEQYNAKNEKGGKAKKQSQTKADGNSGDKD